MQPAYKRILLKLSGEVLAGKEGHGINFDTVSDVCKHVKKCSEMGVQIGLVVGGETSGAAAPAVIWTEPEPTI